MHILSFDVESNGLHGQAFAVGAVVKEVESAEPPIVAFFRCPIEGEVDQWVGDNVIPAITDMVITHADASTMRSDFWRWLRSCMNTYSDLIVVVDVGYPVEARFLMACQDDDPARAWEAPYPLHEVASLLLAADVDPDIDRFSYAGMDDELAKHNPINDALASLKCAEICFARLT